MKIDPAKNLVSGLDPRTAASEQPEALPKKTDKQETPQGDRVDLSVSRNLININELSPEAAAIEKLDTDRIAEIQQRVRSGFYGSDAALRGATDGILELFSA